MWAVCIGVGETIQVLHILAFLGDILHVLPNNSVKTVCETILKLLALNNVVSF